MKDIQFTFIELSKFIKSKVDELENNIERWCYFFKYAEETTDLDLNKIIDQEPIVGLVYSEVHKFHRTEQELAEY